MQTASHSNVLISSLGLGLILALGCGGPSGPVTVDVTGSVTIDGQPVETGTIAFTPQDGKGRTDGAQIEGGRYEAQLVPGEKRVEITASKETGEVVDGIQTYVSLVPAKYNTESTLTASVTESGESTFDFALDSK